MQHLFKPRSFQKAKITGSRAATSEYQTSRIGIRPQLKRYPRHLVKSNNNNELGAIVIGSGVSGLSAAQALSHHFGKVKILDRDVSPGDLDMKGRHAVQDSNLRPGVPHFRQVHLLLAGGLVALEELFPDFQKTVMHTCGAVYIPSFREDLVHFDQARGRLAESPRPSSLPLVFAPRYDIEKAMRMVLADNPRISFCPGSSVEKLAMEADANTGSPRVVGVKLMGKEDVIRADLVVDASGRRSTVVKGLVNAEVEGVEKVPTEEVDAKVVYYTRYLEMPPRLIELMEGKSIWWQAPCPDWPRGCVLLRQGEGYGACLCFEYNSRPRGLGPPGPSHDRQHMDLLAACCRPVHDLLVESGGPKWLTPTLTYADTASVRRYFDRIHMPERLVILGDALCAFNPTYAQGMTVGAMEALKLKELLARRMRGQVSADVLEGLADEWQRAARPLVDSCWELIKSNDARFPLTTQQAPTVNMDPLQAFIRDIMSKYHQQVDSMVDTDWDVQAAFDRVQHMLDPPSSLYSPRVAAKVVPRLAAQIWGQMTEGLSSHQWAISPLEMSPRGQQSSSCK